MDSKTGDDIPEDESIESLKRKIEESKKAEREILEKSEVLSNKISSIDKLANQLMDEAEQRVYKLKSIRERSSKIRIELMKKESLSSSKLDLLEKEISEMEGQVSLKTNPIPLGNLSDSAVRNDTSTQSKFQSKNFVKPVNTKVLRNYSVFKYLSEEEQLTAYGNLLKLRILKIRILEKLLDGVYQTIRISNELGTSDSVIQENLRTLADFGNISTDFRELSEYAKYTISLYRFIKGKSREDPEYAALAIYPVLILNSNGRYASTIQAYTGIDTQSIISGAKILKKENLVHESSVGGRLLYMGDTQESKKLFKAMSVLIES